MFCREDLHLLGFTCLMKSTFFVDDNFLHVSYLTQAGLKIADLAPQPEICWNRQNALFLSHSAWNWIKMLWDDQALWKTFVRPLNRNWGVCSSCVVRVASFCVITMFRDWIVFWGFKTVLCQFKDKFKWEMCFFMSMSLPHTLQSFNIFFYPLSVHY